MLQPLDELEQWHKRRDPWEYRDNSDDQKRKHILLSEIPERKYKNVLDIGCGQGFITRALPGKKILGVDVSKNAIANARKQTKKKNISFKVGNILNLDKEIEGKFDLIVITGVLYPQYTNNSNNLIYLIIDKLLAKNGILATVHIDEWYSARFPYLMLGQRFYSYLEFTHRLEVYIK